MFLQTGYEQLSLQSKSCACLTRPSVRGLVRMHTFSLFIRLCLTSYFAVVMITAATRCHCLTRSVKMSCNKLLSQSSYLVVLLKDDELQCSDNYT